MSEARTHNEEMSEQVIDLPPVAAPADAEWQLRRLRRIQRDLAEVRETYERLTAETEAWFLAETEGREADAAEIERQLAGWLSARILTDPHGPKSVALPSAKLASTKGSLVVEVVDQDAFMAWAEDNAKHLIRRPEPKDPPPPAPDKVALKAAVDTEHYDDPGTYPALWVHANDDGEAMRTPIPGVDLVRAERSLDITFTEH